jgi:hypothetical protein
VIGVQPVAFTNMVEKETEMGKFFITFIMFFLIIFVIVTLVKCTDDLKSNEFVEVVTDGEDNEEHLSIPSTPATSEQEEEKEEPVYKWDIWKDLIARGFRSSSWLSYFNDSIAVSFIMIGDNYYFRFPYTVKERPSAYLFGELIIRDIEEVSPGEILMTCSQATLKLKFYDFVGVESDPIRNPSLFWWVTKVMEIEIIDSYNSAKTELNSVIAVRTIFYK